jgi:hypothetical protein
VRNDDSTKNFVGFYVAAKERGSAKDSKTTQHENYSISEWIPKRIDEHVDWEKTVGLVVGSGV